MADEKQVDLLKQGAKVWNKWREDKPGVVLNLDGADLIYANLSFADLTGANLNFAYLSGANLDGTDLSFAYLSGANLTSANLIYANLSGANLSFANLIYANLSFANLSGVNLTRAGLNTTIFGFAYLADVKGLETCRHYGPSSIDFQTLQRFGPLPLAFLRGVGLPDNFINYLPSLLNQEFCSVFISYSHADKSFAQRLYNELQGRGIRCWLDEHQLLPGDDILDQIDHGIRLWDKILLCCSEASLKRSPWVDREIGKALQKEEALWKERGKKVLALIPLNIDGYLLHWDSGKASVLKERRAGDFTGWEHDNAKFEAEFEKVVRALRADEGGRTPPPVSRL